MVSLSAFMCNYNHGRYLAQSIESVLTQSRLPDEFIILDDCSTDDSVAIIESYARRYPIIRFFRNDQNLGGVASMEKAMSLARFDYLVGASADDYWLPGYIEEGMKLAEQYPHAGVIFGMVKAVDQNNAELATFSASQWYESRFATPAEYLNEFLETEPPSHSLCSATIYKRSALAEAGWFRRELGHWCDTFAVRAIGLKHGICYISRPCAAWRVVSGSLSQSSNNAPNIGLSVIVKASSFMRSPEFRDRFPEDHVARWGKGYSDIILSDSYRHSVAEAAQLIIDQLHPTSVIDLDCGAGLWLKELQKLGITDICGISDNTGAVRINNPNLLPLTNTHDFSAPLPLNKKYDLCLCLGLPSRMPPEMEENILNACTTASDTILFAFPPRGGSGYLNRKSFDYWCAKFLDKGFALTDSIRPNLPKEWQIQANDELNIWLARRTNTMQHDLHTLFTENAARLEAVYQENITLAAENKALQEQIQSNRNLSAAIGELFAALPAGELTLPPTRIIKENGHCSAYPFQSVAGRIYSHLPDYAGQHLLEDGTPLASPNAMHDHIRTVGKGHYSLWQNQIYFSSSDNTDPATNGRRYSLKMPQCIATAEMECAQKSVEQTTGTVATSTSPHTCTGQSQALSAKELTDRALASFKAFRFSAAIDDFIRLVTYYPEVATGKELLIKSVYSAMNFVELGGDINAIATGMESYLSLVPNDNETRRRWMALEAMQRYPQKSEPALFRTFAENVIRKKTDPWGAEVKEYTGGQMHADVYSMLYHLAASMPFDHDILDIGCGMGACAMSLAKGLKESGKRSRVIAVDDCVTSPGGQHADKGHDWIYNTVIGNFNHFGVADKIKLWPHMLRPELAPEVKALITERKLSIMLVDASGDLINELAPFIDMIVPGGYLIIDDYGEEDTEVNCKMVETMEAADRFIREGKIIPLGRFGWMGCTIFCYKP